jgi:YesN/AraC family two-component response regulator
MNPMIRILLVDDHPLVRDGVSMRLQATDHIRVVGEAASVDQALPLVRALSPDLVVTDIRMPGASGIDLAALFRDQFPLVRVLVLSMHEDPEYVRRAESNTLPNGKAAMKIVDRKCHRKYTAFRSKGENVR